MNTLVNRGTALQFVERHGIVLESAHGPVVTFADAVAGERIRGNWWSHPKSHQIFALTRLVRNSPDVLICRLVDGKITYVHRRVWPALVRLAGELRHDRLAEIREVHYPARQARGESPLLSRLGARPSSTCGRSSQRR